MLDKNRVKHPIIDIFLVINVLKKRFGSFYDAVKLSFLPAVCDPKRAS